MSEVLQRPLHLWETEHLESVLLDEVGTPAFLRKARVLWEARCDKSPLAKRLLLEASPQE